MAPAHFLRPLAQCGKTGGAQTTKNHPNCTALACNCDSPAGSKTLDQHHYDQYEDKSNLWAMTPSPKTIEELLLLPHMHALKSRPHRQSGNIYIYTVKYIVYSYSNPKESHPVQPALKSAESAEVQRKEISPWPLLGPRVPNHSSFRAKKVRNAACCSSAMLHLAVRNLPNACLTDKDRCDNVMK